MLSAVLLLFLSAYASASPVVTIRDSLVSLPLAKRVSVTDPQHIVRDDRARAAQLLALAESKSSGTSPVKRASVPITNKAVSYVASVGVGSPPTQYSLIVDSGSSNIWVGAGKPYVPTSSSSDTGESVNVSYGSGSFSGKEYTDTVSLGPRLKIIKQSIGVANKSTGFDGVDGIVGIGPVDLTSGTLSPSSSELVPTVTDNLHSQGTIPADIVSVSFEPTTTSDNTNGVLTFGGVDESKFIGPIFFTPITTTSPASTFWGIDQSIHYGTKTILSTTAGIVDTGTTLILIATDAFKTYQEATGAVPDDATGLLKLTPEQFDKLESLFFIIGDIPFELTANAQIWPRSLNSAIGGAADGIYLIVSDSGSNSGSGLDFLNGQAFLERFYSVFDTEHRQVGLAYTPHTFDTTN